jgi:hypothetical protein
MPARPPTAADPEYLRATAQALREDVALLAAHEPPPAPAAPALSAAEKAARLRDLGAAAYLYGSGSPVLGEAMDVEAWKIVLDDFLKEMGLSAAAGPVARMMAEQLLLAHHAVGRLHVRAATRTSAAEVAAYHAAAARLMTEFRRTSAALRAYGAGAARRAAPAPRAKRHTPSGARPARRAKKAQRGKVASNGNGVRGHVRGRKHAIA